jgi:hypothetical protein
LLLADALDEAGVDAVGELIRVQVELAKHPERFVIDEVCAIDRAGPNYFTISSGARIKGGGILLMEAKPGDRVDILKPSTSRRERARQRLGLRLLKYVGGEEGDEEAVLVRDAESVPDPRIPLLAEQDRLWPRAAPWHEAMLESAGLTRTSYWLGHAGIDVPGRPRVAHADAEYVVERGLVSRVEVMRLGDVYGDQPCPDCGVRWSSNYKGCPSCSGLGRTRACQACDGSGGRGGYDGEDAPEPCRACDGHGRLAPLAVGRLPVTRVYAGDRLPFQGRLGFIWLRGHENTDYGVSAAHIPPPVFDAMQPDPNRATTNPEPTSDDAVRLLAIALASWARGRRA